MPETFATPLETPDALPDRCAAMDIGTNSVKLTVADLTPEHATLVYDESRATRLGEGMHAFGSRLREAPMRRTLDALAEYMEIARERKARAIAAVGTAALRDAVNRDEFLQRAQQQCGLALEVISGEEEARLSFLAVRRDPHWRGCPHLVVIDIGGGSTEIIQSEPDTSRIAARISVNLGAVKLTERFLKSDPPTINQLAGANRAVAEAFGEAALNAPGPEAQIVGVGGTLTNLAGIALGGRPQPEGLHGYTLTADNLEDIVEQLALRTVEERRQIPGLDPARADIILGGAILLSQALARIGSAALDVSTRGLRWGVLYDRFLRA